MLVGIVGVEFDFECIFEFVGFGEVFDLYLICGFFVCLCLIGVV